MNICTNSRSSAARVFSWVLAFALIFSLAAAPAASADDGTYSAEVIFSADGMDISGKLTLDTNQLLLGALAAMVSEGETVMDGAAYLSTQAFAIDSLLLGGAYGLDLTTLAQNLPSSIFAPASGSAYAFDEDTYQQILDLLSGKALETVQVPSMDTSAAEEALAVLVEAYSEIPEQVMALMSIESSNASTIVNNKPIQVEQIRCTADADTAVAITELLLQPAIDSTQVQDALAVLIDLFAASSQQELDVTGEELVKVLVEELPGELDTTRQELAASGFQVSSVICVSTETQMPVKFALEMEAEGSNLAINLLLSDELDFFRFEVLEDGVASAALVFQIPENSENVLVLQLSVEEHNEETAVMRFELNRAGKTFLASFAADDETASLSGFYTISDNLFSVTVDKLDGQDFGGTITLNLRADDTISLPSFTEVSTMTEEEFTTLVQTVSAIVESFTGTAE